MTKFKLPIPCDPSKQVDYIAGLKDLGWLNGEISNPKIECNFNGALMFSIGDSEKEVDQFKDNLSKFEIQTDPNSQEAELQVCWNSTGCLPLDTMRTWYKQTGIGLFKDSKTKFPSLEACRPVTMLGLVERDYKKLDHLLSDPQSKNLMALFRHFTPSISYLECASNQENIENFKSTYSFRMDSKALTASIRALKEAMLMLKEGKIEDESVLKSHAEKIKNVYADNAEEEIEKQIQGLKLARAVLSGKPDAAIEAIDKLDTDAQKLIDKLQTLHPEVGGDVKDPNDMTSTLFLGMVSLFAVGGALGNVLSKQLDSLEQTIKIARRGFLAVKAKNISKELQSLQNQGKLPPYVGNMDTVAEILTTVSSPDGRRSAILVAPKGSGKSAAFEYIAANKDILAEKFDFLKNADLFGMLPSDFSGGSEPGRGVKNVKDFEADIDNRWNNGKGKLTIVFMDEIDSLPYVDRHSGATNMSEVANALKPMLMSGRTGKGSPVIIVGATTPFGYERMIKEERDLQDRFGDPIRVSTPTPEQLRIIIKAHMERMEKVYNVQFERDSKTGEMLLLDKIPDYAKATMSYTNEPRRSIEFLRSLVLYPRNQETFRELSGLQDRIKQSYGQTAQTDPKWLRTAKGFGRVALGVVKMVVEPFRLMFKGWKKIINVFFPHQPRAISETIHYKDKVSITEKTLNDLLADQRKLHESILGAKLKLSESHLGRRVDIPEHLWQPLRNEEVGESIKRRYGMLEDLMAYIERHGKANVYDTEVPAFESTHIEDAEMQIIKLKKELLRRAGELGLGAKIKISEEVWTGSTEHNREHVLKNIEAFTALYSNQPITSVPIFDIEKNYLQTVEGSNIESSDASEKAIREAKDRLLEIRDFVQSELDPLEKRVKLTGAVSEELSAEINNKRELLLAIDDAIRGGSLRDLVIFSEDMMKQIRESQIAPILPDDVKQVKAVIEPHLKNLSKTFPNTIILAVEMNVDLRGLSAIELMNAMESQAKMIVVDGKLPFGFVGDFIKQFNSNHQGLSELEKAHAFMEFANKGYAEKDLDLFKKRSVAEMGELKKRTEVERVGVRPHSVEDKKAPERPKPIGRR